MCLCVCVQKYLWSRSRPHSFGRYPLPTTSVSLVSPSGTRVGLTSDVCSSSLITRLQLLADFRFPPLFPIPYLTQVKKVFSDPLRLSKRNSLHFRPLTVINLWVTRGTCRLGVLLGHPTPNSHDVKSSLLTLRVPQPY